MVLDFVKDAIKDFPKKKICNICKKEMEPCVCDFFVTHILEEGEENTCSQCWTSKINQLYEQEFHTRQILERILTERNK